MAKRNQSAETKVIAAPGATGGYKFRGATRELVVSRDHEIILAGPAQTGKTVGACYKLHLACSLIPETQCAMIRKSYASIPGTVARTFWRIAKAQGVKAMGGDKPYKYVYPNGSAVWIGGMDNPDRVLSAERDLIYVCQAEELAEADWEVLGSRCTGRGAVIAHPQLFGDCNPAGSRHWIVERAKKGTLRLLNAVHRDNPVLYDEAGNMTEEGKLQLGRLASSLSGVRFDRLFSGKWVSAEGAVFPNFDARITNKPSDHVQVKDWRLVKRWFVCQDAGFTNPAAVLLCGDDSDGRRHVFKEWYHTQKLESEAADTGALFWKSPTLTAKNLTVDEIDRFRSDPEWIKTMEAETRAELDAVDEAAPSLVAALQARGVNAKGGKGRIEEGNNRTRDRLALAGDGLPRLTMDPSCVNLINEFESHIFEKKQDGTLTDKPLDKDNHAIAALRYLEDVLAEPTGAFDAKTAHELSTQGQPEPMGRSVNPRSWPGR